jgi:predicted nucleotidyltransferase component of viral defense system
MIKSTEIARKANAEGIRQQQIEKDYIISWILWGIYNNDQLNDALIFKGGTCIKKIYIEEFRYSEDMDFTLNPENEKEITNKDI